MMRRRNLLAANTSIAPTNEPSQTPSMEPTTFAPSMEPSVQPTMLPTTEPTDSGQLPYQRATTKIYNCILGNSENAQNLITLDFISNNFINYNVNNSRFFMESSIIQENSNVEDVILLDGRNPFGSVALHSNKFMVILCAWT